MIKKIALTLGAAALACSSHAALVSLGFSGTLTNDKAYSGFISWDTSQPTPTPSFNLSAFSLQIDGTDYTSALTLSPGAGEMRVFNSTYTEDSFYAEAGVSNGTGQLLHATKVALTILGKADQSTLFNGATALPTNIGFVQGLDAKTLAIHIDGADDVFGRTLEFGEPVIVTPPPPPPPNASVPEPGSLLLVALAGLALGATRRRRVA